MAYQTPLANRLSATLVLCLGLLGVSHWLQAAEPLPVDAGDQYLLGLLFQHGYGVDPDRRRAAYWYRQAVQRDDPRARYALALLLVKQSAEPTIVARAVALLERAARQGLPEAQFEYANWLTAGVLIPSDLVKASSYYRKAAEAGHRESRCRLCRIYSQVPSLKHLQSTERHCEICAGASRQPAPDDPAGLMPPARYSGCGAMAVAASTG